MTVTDNRSSDIKTRIDNNFAKFEELRGFL